VLLCCWSIQNCFWWLTSVDGIHPLPVELHPLVVHLPLHLSFRLELHFVQQPVDNLFVSFLGVRHYIRSIFFSKNLLNICCKTKFGREKNSVRRWISQRFQLGKVQLHSRNHTTLPQLSCSSSLLGLTVYRKRIFLFIY